MAKMLLDSVKPVGVSEPRQFDRATSIPAGWLLLFVVCGLSFGLLAARLHQGYIPVDDPLLAHAAERTLNGEMPQVDFHDNYTGGLSYLHAFALRIFGIRLISLRFMLFSFFLVWVPTFWYIASRIASSLAACLITLLAVVWSIPIYPSPVGSWYSLYFATFGTASLMRFIETRHSRWIFLAGLSAGLSFLAKISGLYLLAALGMFLVFDEQNVRGSTNLERRTSTSYLYPVLITLAMLAFNSALFLLIHSKPGATEFYHFVIPGLMLSVLLVTRDWHNPGSPALVRFRQMGTRLGPFVLGFVAPVTVFLIPYAYTGTLGKLFTEIFVRPRARLQFVFSPAIHPVGAIFSIPVFVILLLDADLKGLISRRVAGALFCLLLGVTLLVSLRHPGLARWVWVSAATTIPLIVVVGVIILWRGRTGPEESSRLMLLLAVVAMCSLIQFPYFVPMYFCYVAPLAMLAFAGLSVRPRPYHSMSLLLPLAVFYLVFGILVIMPNQIYNKALSFEPEPQEAFTLPRAGGIRGAKATVEMTEQAVSMVLAHSGGAAIYAGPDSPEFYFLTGLRNPTPNLVEFLGGADGEPSHLFTAIEKAGVKAVVLNHIPGNDSGPLPAELVAKFKDRFPESVTIGPLEVRWRQ